MITLRRTLSPAVLLLSPLCASLAQTPHPRSKPPRPVIAILIGLAPGPERPDDGRQSADPRNDSTPGSSKSRVDAVPSGKVHHLTATERLDPLATLLMAISADTVKTRLVQHIIVPRSGGFWQLGVTTDVAGLETNDADSSTVEWSYRDASDLFWLAPLGQSPRFASIESETVGCGDRATTRALTFVGSDYLGYAEFSEGACAHYSESHSLSVLSLDSIYASSLRSRDAMGMPISLLGPRARDEVRRLGRAAKGWPADCGTPGFASDDAQWTVRRGHGDWRPVVNFTGDGAGICDRESVEVPIAHTTARALIPSASPLPIPWSRISATFPGATDASPSPNGRLIVVFMPGQLIVAAVHRRRLQRLGPPISIPCARPVMLQWARDSQVAHWSDALSTLPELSVADTASSGAC